MKGQAAGGRMAGLTPPRYRLALWDWNGTLLDDRDYAIGVRNRVFPGFGLPRLESVAEYYQQFTFPVHLYYERAGVTPENFTAVANAWMAEYVRGAAEIPLHRDARDALTRLRAAGIPQAVLSASSTEILTAQLAQYGIEAYFTAILGLSHIYATSKQAIGEAYLLASGIPPGSCLLFGDTLHDAEVARALGIDCVLIARGHQSAEALLSSGYPVCHSLAEAVAMALGE